MKAVLRALNIEQGEETLVLLILIQSFFIGTFMATFDVAANALFFTSFEGKDLGQAYALSAVAGMFFTYIYIKLQSWISFTKLAIINLSFISLMAILMRVGFQFSDSKELIYTVFLLQGPLNTLAIVGFWGLMGRIFNLRQGKRLFGLVDSGQILGMIIILFAVPFIRTIMPNTEDLIIISVVGIVMSVVMQFVLSAKFGDVIKGEIKEVAEGEVKQKQGIGMLDMLKNPYIFMMVVFVMLAMLSQFFVHYSFLVIANTKYPTAGEFASFFAVFMGMLMVFTFVFKTFVFGKLMEMYGLRVNLLILPFLLIFFTIIACISGTFFGFESDSKGFMMFFLFIAISKLFAQSLRGAIEVPAFKLLYQPLDNSIKFDVQAKIDGTVNEFSALIGGLVLMGMGLISFVNLLSYSYVLALIMVVYIFVSVKLYVRYKDTLRSTLDSFKDKLANVIKRKTIKDVLDESIEAKRGEKIISTLKICREINPVLFESKLEEVLNKSSVEVKTFALNNIDAMGLTHFKDLVKKGSEENVKELADKVISKFDLKDVTKDLKTVGKYLRSKNPYDKILLINEICRNKSTSNLPAISELLKDPNTKVKQSAIIAVGKLKEIALLPSVIENINNPIHRSIVTSTLLTFGDGMLNLLDNAFYKSNFDSHTLEHIINVYSDSKSEKAIPLLLKKLNFPDQRVVTATLTALRNFNFQAESSEAVKVQQTIEGTVGVALWNMVALEESREYELPKSLSKSLEEEVASNIDLIYTLLSLLYDPQSITNIRQNIESGTAEGIGFAIELLDLFVAEELKSKLFPLFDDLDLDEKIYRLEEYYPIERLTKDQLLTQLINRDYNNINRWTKALALFAFTLDEDLELKDDFVAHLFNEDKLMFETAAWTINSVSEEAFVKYSKRLDEKKFNLVTELIGDKLKGKELLYVEQGLLLYNNKWLSKINGRVIAEMAMAMEKIIVPANKNLNEIIDEYPLGIVFKGELSFKDASGEEVGIKKGDIFSDLVINEKDDLMMSVEEAEIYIIRNEIFFDLFYAYDDFSELIMGMIESYFGENLIEKKKV